MIRGRALFCLSEMVDKLKKIHPAFRGALKGISGIARRSGSKIYLVGGVVRDLLLGKISYDLDIVVEGDAIALASRLAGYFRHKFRKHHSFGTATVYFGRHKIDFVTARREKYCHPGALPKVRPAGLKEDLWRRDFTINAMAVSLNDGDYGKVIDFYGGLADLRRGTIKIMHENSFWDDPTRILRAIRFERRFSFTMEKGTFNRLKAALGAGALSFVNIHRIRDELILSLKEDDPVRHIRRVSRLTRFSFFGPGMAFDGSDFKLLSRIKNSIDLYGREFKSGGEISEWLIYLMAVFIKFPREKFSRFLASFGLKKKDALKVCAVRNNLNEFGKMAGCGRMSLIFRGMREFSMESLVFFYAYYTDKRLRRNIRRFMGGLKGAKLSVQGRDLKKIGIRPDKIYGKILSRLLDVKIDRGLETKRDEIAEAKKIFARLASRGRGAF